MVDMLSKCCSHIPHTLAFIWSHLRPPNECKRNTNRTALWFGVGVRGGNWQVLCSFQQLRWCFTNIGLPRCCVFALDCAVVHHNLQFAAVACFLVAPVSTQIIFVSLPWPTAPFLLCCCCSSACLVPKDVVWFLIVFVWHLMAEQSQRKLGGGSIYCCEGFCRGKNRLNG